MKSPLESGTFLVFFAFLVLQLSLADASIAPSTTLVPEKDEGEFVTQEGGAIKLLQVDPADLGEVDGKGNLIGGTKACLYRHEKREERIRALIQQNKHKSNRTLLKLIRKAIGRRRFRAWKKYTNAMKELGRNGKCGAVWNKESDLYYACCVFRVGEDNSGQMSCLTPWSLGQTKHSPGDKGLPKFGIHYGFNDVVGSLATKERNELKKELQRKSDSILSIKFLNDEGIFQTKLLLDLADKAQKEKTEELTKQILESLLAKEVKRLRLSRCGNFKRKFPKPYNKIHRGLSTDIQKVTACVTSAYAKYGMEKQESLNVEKIALQCQHMMSKVIAVHRDAIFNLVTKCRRRNKGMKSVTGLTGFAGSPSGLWELDFFAQTWIWNFDYIDSGTKSFAGSRSSMAEQTTRWCIHPATTYYTVCCDSMLALTPLCQQLHENLP